MSAAAAVPFPSSLSSDVLCSYFLGRYLLKSDAYCPEHLTVPFHVELLIVGTEASVSRLLRGS